MTNPTISIIVPVYNTADYLQRCIESILNQTFKDFELILIDDGSNDKSFELCQNYKDKDERIILIHKENGGQSSARNLGMSKATGDYYTFVDSDDWVAKDFLEVLHSLITKYDADIAVVNYCKVYDNIETVKENDVATEKLWSRDEAVKYFFEQSESNIAVWNKLYKKRAIVGCSFIEGRYYEDYYFQLSALKNVENVAVSTSIKYFYYQRANSTVHTKTSQKELDNICAFFACMPIIRDYFVFEETFCIQSMAEHFYFFSASNKFSDSVRRSNSVFLKQVQDITGMPSEAIQKSRNPFSYIFYTYSYHREYLTRSERKALQSDYRICWKSVCFKDRRSLAYLLGYVSLEVAMKLKGK